MSARPLGVTALACFFVFGVLASAVAAAALFTPGGALEPVWRLNPRGHEGFVRIGVWAPILLFAVTLSCAAAAYGFFTGRRWGYWLGVALLLINGTGDIINTALGTDRRAVIGVPIVAILLWYLSTKRVRGFFSVGHADAD
jgi:hypothetical protein